MAIFIFRGLPNVTIIDLSLLMKIVSGWAGSSWMFADRVPHMLDYNFTTCSSVNIFVTDLGLIADTGYAKKSRCF